MADELRAKALKVLQNLLDDYNTAKETGDEHNIVLTNLAFLGGVEVYEGMFEEEVYWYGGKITTEKAQED